MPQTIERPKWITDLAGRMNESRQLPVGWNGCVGLPALLKCANRLGATTRQIDPDQHI